MNLQYSELPGKQKLEWCAMVWRRKQEEMTKAELNDYLE